MPIVRPDDFTGTDTARLQQCFDAVAWSSSNPLEVTLDRSYLVERTIVVRAPAVPPPGKPYGRVIIHALRGELKWRGQEGASVLKIGDPQGNHKIWWSRIEGLRIENAGGSPVNGYEVAHAHALRLVECNGLGVKCSSPANYLSMEHCFFAGAADRPAADLWGNLMRVTGGKYQQANVGIKARGGMVEIDGVDVSICTDAGVLFDQVGGGRLSGWAEQIGPRQPGNQAAVIRAVNSFWIRIDGMQLNCVNGSTGSGTHAGYAVDLVGSHHISIDHGEVQMPTIAGIRLDRACGEGNTVRRGAEWIPDPQWPGARFVDDQSGRLAIER